ncbi:phospholipid-transporting ATPase ABCA3-like isoform X3 [Macrotis lagotis]|uniref:phospholipid-transporting ATPase ABCA3-like isoform X3 n=1 Tax=Macrotis lagotis TaxID=92651 RepID=UPI003D691EE4
MNWFRDLMLLIWKNCTLLKRHLFLVLTELIGTLLFPLLLLFFRHVIKETTPQSYNYSSIPINKLPAFFENLFEKNTWELVYVPSGSKAVKTIVEDVYESIGIAMKVTGFSSEQSFEHYIRYDKNSSDVLAAIIFNHDFYNSKDTLPLQVSYTLRFSNTARNLWYFWKNVLIRDEVAVWHTDLLFPVFPETGPRNPEFDDGGSPVGFVFSLMIFNLIRFVVWEKEKQLKEYLRIMGISSLLLWSSYFFTFLLFLLLNIILLTLILLVKIVEEPIICYSDGSLVFFFLMCSAIVSILFGFVISTFFNSANTAAAIGTFIYFMTCLPYIYIHSYYGVMSLHKKIFSCLLSNVAILLGIQILIASEVSEKGIHWTKFIQPVTNNDTLTIGHIIGMLIFDSFFYALLTWYIEAVFPGNYGIPHPWNFFMMNSYWFGTTTSTVEMDIEDDDVFKNPFIEEVPIDLEAQIQIKHLSKVFIINHIENCVVNDLTLNFYKGQITVLLGNHGAGKSTILSMLIGMFPPTSGEAYVCGYEISKGMVQIRKIISFCPQYDILFDHMTVADHLYFYALLKGLTLKECHKEIEQTLKFFNLEEKRNYFSRSLTAGMKRELTISIALLGDSQVIILDEPTLRMDPIIRNSTWNLLQQHKHGHTIVMTTTNMTEADLLGDRIAIMVEGELQCCGSSLFLKHKYGSGYHMIIVKEPNCDIEKISQIVEQCVPDAILERNFGVELYFSLPTENANRFEALFTALESKQKDLGIVSFRVSVTAMEEVFLRAHKLMDSTINFQAIPLASSWSENEKVIISQSKRDKDYFQKRKSPQSFMSLSPPPLMFSTEYKLYYQQFHAMFSKRAMYYWRNWKMTLIHTLAPVVFSSLLISIFQTLITHNYSSLNLNLHKYGKTIVPYSVSGNTSLLNKASGYLNIMLKSRGQKPKLVKGKLEDFLIESRNCIEHCIVAISLKVTNGKLIATALFNNQAYHSPGTALAVLDNILFMLLSGPEASVVVANKPQPFSVWNAARDNFLQSANGLQIAFSICFGLSPLVSTFSFQIVSERISKVKHIQFVTGVYVLIFWLSALIWDLFNFFIPCLLFLVVFKVCDIEAFYNHFMNILMIFMLYGWSVIPLMYLMSFFFLRSAAAYTKLILFNIFSGWTSFLFSFFIQIKAFYFRKYVETMGDILLVIPAYNLAMALSGFYDYVRSKALCDLLTTTTDCDEYNQSIYRVKGKGIGKFLIAMAVLGFVFLFILFLIEIYSWKIRNYFARFLLNVYQMRNGNLEMKSDPVEFPSDEDVALERQKVLECPKDMISSLNCPLIIRKLTKVYFKKVPTIAVNKLSLTVQKGECLGLLGFSGSGKTSTFKMLTGEETITYGDAFFENHSLCENIGKVRKITGYCPQYSALLDHMTGREMLIMYARIRGIHESYIQSHVEQILHLLKMGIDSDKLTKTYSGSTKQKLSNAIALLGFPPIIFLDEPSSGMNPIAQRLLWDLVTQTRESGKVIILSSKSMEECDALCTRLAIMVNGKLQCLGSPQYLKKKFSKGYILMAKIKSDSKENEMEYFKKHIIMKFTGSKIIQEHQGMVKFHIPSENLSWAKVFGMMENIKNNYNLEDYSISQTTLEHVFMTFASSRREDEIKE